MYNIHNTYLLFLNYTEYDESDDIYPNLICIITGKGPLKYHYQQMISKLKWKKVSIITPWLENNDYPILLGKLY